MTRSPLALIEFNNRVSKGWFLILSAASTIPASVDVAIEESHPTEFDSIFWSIVSTECGDIPSSANPGISGDVTVSISISST